MEGCCGGLRKVAVEAYHGRLTEEGKDVYRGRLAEAYGRLRKWRQLWKV